MDDMGGACTRNEMIFQMLSRKERTPAEIAKFLKCSVGEVRGVAEDRPREIEENYQEYLRCAEIVERAADGVGRDTEGAAFAGARVLRTMWGGHRAYRTYPKIRG